MQKYTRETLFRLVSSNINFIKNSNKENKRNQNKHMKTPIKHSLCLIQTRRGFVYTILFSSKYLPYT